MFCYTAQEDNAFFLIKVVTEFNGIFRTKLNDCEFCVVINCYLGKSFKYWF